MMFSPITKLRLSRFAANKRGFWSFWIFITLFVITIFSEFIANDKPILINFNDEFFFPIFKFYPETTFGGTFKTEANYKDPFVIKLIEKKGWMIWPPIRYSFDTVNYNLSTPAPSPPPLSLKELRSGKWENLLGTDDQGRDVLARLLYGFRISIFFGLILTLFGSVIGIIAGAIQGYFGGKIDIVFQRFIEIWSGLPILYLLILLSSFTEPGFWLLLLLMLLFSWTNLVGIVRAEFLRARNFDYVRAAQALGLSTPLIMSRHVLPNAMVATLTYLPFVLNGSIATLTTLDFLGFGLPPGSPSLGELLAQGKNNLYAWWLGITAFISLALLLSLLIFIGEAVRDAFDTRKITQ